MNDTHCNCDVRSVNHFLDWNDYDYFSEMLKKDKNFISVSVTEKYSNFGFLERWYRCVKCQTVWRLVEPDPPFKGLWERLKTE